MIFSILEPLRELVFAVHFAQRFFSRLLTGEYIPRQKPFTLLSLPLTPPCHPSSAKTLPFSSRQTHYALILLIFLEELQTVSVSPLISLPLTGHSYPPGAIQQFFVVVVFSAF
jgi:hypothetical protein